MELWVKIPRWKFWSFPMHANKVQWGGYDYGVYQNFRGQGEFKSDPKARPGQ